MPDPTVECRLVREIASVAFEHAIYYVSRGGGRVLAFAVVDSESEPTIPPRVSRDLPPNRGVMIYLAGGPEDVRGEVRRKRPGLDAYAIGWAGRYPERQAADPVDALFVEAAMRAEEAGRLYVQPYIHPREARELIRLGSFFVARATENLLGR